MMILISIWWQHGDDFAKHMMTMIWTYEHMMTTIGAPPTRLTATRTRWRRRSTWLIWRALRSLEERWVFMFSSFRIMRMIMEGIFWHSLWPGERGGGSLGRSPWPQVVPLHERTSHPWCWLLWPLALDFLSTQPSIKPILTSSCFLRHKNISPLPEYSDSMVVTQKKN